MEPKRTSLSTWRASLHRLQEQLLARPNKPPRIAVLGIGNPLRSDDAAGVLVARGLAEARLTRDPESLLVIDAGHAPENRTAELRRFAPDVVLLIDAAELGEEPGGIRQVEIDEIDGMSASTHTLPLSMLAKYLTLELACEIYILGIQPRSTEFDGLVSAEVLQAVNEIVKELAKSLSVFTAQEITCLN